MDKVVYKMGRWFCIFLLGNWVWMEKGCMKNGCIHRNFFRRKGDNASSKGCNFKYQLSDKTEFNINIEVIYYPLDIKKIVWYIGIFSLDRNRKLANNSIYGKSVTNKQVKRLFNIALGCKNMLLNLPWKERNKIIKSWIKQVM